MNRSKNTLNLLSGQAAERRHEVSLYSCDKKVKSDEDADSECSIFDSLYEVDENEANAKIINFTAPEFQKFMVFCIIISKLPGMQVAGRGHITNQ